MIRIRDTSIDIEMGNISRLKLTSKHRIHYPLIHIEECIFYFKPESYTIKKHKKRRKTNKQMKL